MTADVELLPCPFCGGRAKTKLPYVRCVDCGGQMCFGDGDAIDAAIASWNSRTHATAAKDAEIEALRAEVDEWKRRGEAYFQTAEQQGKRAELLAEALAADRERWEAQKAGAIRDQAGGMTRGDTAAVSRCDAAIQRIDDALEAAREARNAKK